MFLSDEMSVLSVGEAEVYINLKPIEKNTRIEPSKCERNQLVSVMP